MEFRLENNNELFGKPDLPTRIVMITLFSAIFLLLVYIISAALQKDMSLLVCFLTTTPIIILIFKYYKWEVPKSPAIIEVDENMVKYLVRRDENYEVEDAVSIEEISYIRKALIWRPRGFTRIEYYLIDRNKRERLRLNPIFVNKDGNNVIDYLYNECDIDIKEETRWKTLKIINNVYMWILLSAVVFGFALSIFK